MDDLNIELVNHITTIHIFSELVANNRLESKNTAVADFSFDADR
jgi:hypothetical protein